MAEAAKQGSETSGVAPHATREQAVALVRTALADAVDPQSFIGPRADALVQRAIHLLRKTQEDPDALHRLEQISCTLMEMSYLRRQGRVNAYASRLLRLRRSAQQL